jgi:hypothetical protein
MRIVRTFAAVGLAAALAVGCSAAGAAPQPRATTTKTVSDRDNGKTIVLHVGDRLKVVLASTYWTIHPSSNVAVLRADGRPVIKGRLRGCVPGEGCGTATQLFAATSPGKVTVGASRISCGEALRCTGGQGFYKISVVVN